MACVFQTPSAYELEMENIYLRRFCIVSLIFVRFMYVVFSFLALLRFPLILSYIGNICIFAVQ